MRSVSPFKHRFSWLALALATALSAPVSADKDAARGELREPVKTPRIAVSAIMTEVGQALIWDADRGEYVVLRVGAWIQGYRIRAIFPSQVVIEGKKPGEHFIFALTPRDKLNKELRNPTPVPIDPYGPQSKSAKAPLDPYGPAADPAPAGPIPSVLAPRKSRVGAADPKPPRVVRAPSGSAAPEPSTAPSPESAPPTAPLDPYASSGPKPLPPRALPEDPYAPVAKSRTKPDPRRSRDPQNPYDSSTAAPAVPAEAPSNDVPVDPYAYGLSDEQARVATVPVTVVRPKPTKATSPRSGRRKRVRLKKAQFDAALSDFHRLSKEISLEPASPAGFKVVSLGRGSYFHRIGLRRGDIILEVAGTPLRSIDDAAAIYAQVASSKAFEARLLRRGKPLTLEFRFSRR